MKDFWNERYANEKFVYGTEPNEFIKQQLDKLDPGKILFPAEGEGRNAVYAALHNWEVTAFDMSENARKKAIQLANENKVSIQYEVSDVLSFDSEKQFDVIAFSYAHFPADIRKKAHKHLMHFLKPGGIVIFEAFAKSQLGSPSGGPKNEAMLFSIEEIKQEFPDLEFDLLKEMTIEISEGIYHQGEAQVIRFVAYKKYTI